MSGLYTNGMNAGVLPWSGSEAIPVDTNNTSGVVPLTAAYSPKQMSAIGHAGEITVTDAATVTCDCSTGSSFFWTLGATGRTWIGSNPSPGQVVFLRLKQDGTGSRTVTTWTNVLWASGTAPTLTTTASATDCLRFTWNAALSKWFGETVGKAYS